MATNETKATRTINDNTVMCILLIVIALLIGGVAVYSIAEVNRINERLDVIEGHIVEIIQPQLDNLEDRINILELQK